MPAKNPRITLTVQPALAARIRRLSELTGTSQSALIAEMLTGASHVFDRMILVLEAAERAKDELRERFVDDAAAAQTKIEASLGLLLEGFDEWTGNLLEEVEAVPRRWPPRGASEARASGGADGAPTPPSNRGVRSHHQNIGEPALARLSADLGREKSKPAKRTKKGVQEGLR